VDVVELTDIQGLISTVGFPIFVAIFMLTKTTKDNHDMRAAINELTTAVKIMSETIKGKGE
jgi:hypothetical protein